MKRGQNVVVNDAPGAPVEQVVAALNNRGVAYRQRGAIEQAIADYTRAMESPGASADARAKALNNRGVAYAQIDADVPARFRKQRDLVVD